MKKDTGTIFVATYLDKVTHAILTSQAKREDRTLLKYLGRYLTKLAKQIDKKNLKEHGPDWPLIKENGDYGTTVKNRKARSARRPTRGTH